MRNKTMGYYDSFDCEEQCEDFYRKQAEDPDWYDKMMDEHDKTNSEDILDRCEIVSLEGLKTSEATYRMEDGLIAAEELDYLWDTNGAHDWLMDVEETNELELLITYWEVELKECEENE